MRGHSHFAYPIAGFVCSLQRLDERLAVDGKQFNFSGKFHLLSIMEQVILKVNRLKAVVSNLEL